MSTTEVDLDALADARLVERIVQKRACEDHPAFLGHFVHCIDAKTGEEFDFDLLTPEEAESIFVEPKDTGWFWHREILDSWLAQILSLELKARQIGITWLAALYALWLMLFRPGTRVLILSVNQDEAQKVIARIWLMYRSLPIHLREHATVTKPARGGDPSQEIELTHADGRKSTILALPATEKAGHGETAALVILDEYSRQDFAAEIWKGITPVIDGGGKVIVISTANGVHNELTREGNYFHYLWQYAASLGIVRRFLSWRRHPKRDETWRATRPLRPADLAEQYPDSPEEAFQNSGQCWFDREKLNAYQTRWREEGRHALYKLEFVEEEGPRGPRARLLRLPEAGGWTVIVEPQRGHRYGIAADVATGKGLDFSSAHIIDLETREWVAEYHARVSEDVYAKDLYYAARWYQMDGPEPVIAVENQGGYGAVVIVALRDGARGRKPYGNLWREEIGHERTLEPRERDDYGFSMSGPNRIQVINGLEEWIRMGYMPWITPELDGELRTFAKAKTNPSPRALEGTNDDRVMSAGISIEIFRRYGAKPQAYKAPPPPQDTFQGYPWER